MPLTLLRSNRLESLAERLAGRLEASWQSEGDVFAADEIIVPSAAVERYLTLALARRHGVCANLRVSFLAAWLWQRIGLVVGEVAERSPLTAGTLQWRILRAFDDAALASQPRLAGYLRQADALMRFELAAEVAGLFERYATYRPDWLLAWAAGKAPDAASGESQPAEDGVWQAALWRHLAGELQLGAQHPAEPFLARLAEDEALRRQVLPRCLRLFALPEIPPLYLQLLASLAGLGIEVELYVLDPCREFWYEIVDTRRLARLQQRGDAHAESGNALLADWGRATRASLSLLVDRLQPDREEELFVLPQQRTALAGLQRAMLELREPAPGECPPDDSIVVHACHGQRRQIEVLHDRLLDLFRQDATLRADEVVVLVPRLDELAPSIAAVFGTQPAARSLPYRLSGLPSASESQLQRAVSRLWALCETRCEAGAVLDLLAEPVLARRFGFDGEAAATLRRWVDEAGIRWGLNEADRQRAGLAGPGRHTFAHGLSRLLLGHALPQSLAPVAGLLPVGDIEGEAAELLGRFALAIDWLTGWVGRLRQAHTASAWAQLLRALFGELVGAGLHDDGSGALADELAAAQETVAALEQSWQQAGFDDPLPLAVIRMLCDRQLAGRALPQGSITFAPLAGLRGLPYRVVCLLDMSDGVFPSAGRAREFDLMAARPRPGDRLRALEDRALFLDALLAARERLLIFYDGRSVRDDAPLPPSVLVAQLLAALGDAPQRRIEHPLQPFSRRYFSGSEPQLFSHVQEYAEALNHARATHALPAPVGVVDEEGEEAARAVQPPFLTGTLAPVALPTAETIELDALLRFLKSPARFWLRQRLGIQLPGQAADIEEVEPLLPDAWGRRRLKSALLDWGMAMFAATAGGGLAAIAALAAGSAAQIAGEPAPTEMHTFRVIPTLREQALAYAEAGGWLPEGALGRQLAEEAWFEVSALLQRLAPLLAEPVLPPLPFALALDRGVTLTGALTRLRAGGLLAWGAQLPTAGGELGLWLEHLLSCALQPAGVTLQTRFFAPDGELTYGALPDDQARAHLAALAALYRAARCSPLPLFPKSAWVYAETLVSKGDAGAALKAATQKWAGGWGSRWCEADEADHALLTRGLIDALRAPLPGGDGRSFAELAEQVFAPLLKGPRTLREPSGTTGSEDGAR